MQPWRRADIKYFYDKQVTRLVYLALGHAHSLGITKVPLPVLRSRSADAAKQPDDCFAAKVTTGPTRHHTLEEQRAYLGCFYVVTSNSTQFARRNPLLQQGGSVYVEVCCENLSRSGSGEDRMAARMVKLAQASGRIAETFGSIFSRTTGESYAELWGVQATAIRAELDRIVEEVDTIGPFFSE